MHKAKLNIDAFLGVTDCQTKTSRNAVIETTAEETELNCGRFVNVVENKQPNKEIIALAEKSYELKSIPVDSDLKIKSKSQFKMATRTIAYTGVLTALVMVLTTFGFGAGQFYFNVGDTLILIAAAIFGPIPAMIAGGVGSLFADIMLYPATMVFSLVIKGTEGLVAGLLFKLVDKYIKNKAILYISSAATMLFSTMLMMTGYFVCQTFLYGTYTAALVALPFDAVQASVSTALAFVILYPLKFIDFKNNLKIR